MTVYWSNEYAILSFQLTSSRRGWRWSVDWNKSQNNFNSHPHEEDDVFCKAHVSCAMSFQLTSSRRGWLYQGRQPMLMKKFQLTSSRRGWRRIAKQQYKTKRNFNSHPHEEDDAIGSVICTSEIISTHILTKRMTSRTVFVWLLWRISTHILTKRMTYIVAHLEWGYEHFNSHPHEEDDNNPDGGHSVRRYFNSHPHEEDDLMVAYDDSVLIISTHILTKRMTQRYCRWIKRVNISTHILTKRMTDLDNIIGGGVPISTHILTKRMTVLAQSGLTAEEHFNSHPHEEDDSVEMSAYRVPYHFNSHPHEEDDKVLEDFLDSIQIFQLTSSRRGWPSLSVIVTSLHTNFNSHPHEEDDHLTGQELEDLSAFQLTSSRRGWLFEVLTISVDTIFQLTSSRRGWRILRGGENNGQKNFNSHPHEEDDGMMKRMKQMIMISTHILTKRMTGLSGPLKALRHNFNSHPHEEDDCARCSGSSLERNFNSHPHEEDDEDEEETDPYEGISTHILTKRMTQNRNVFLCLWVISTHILTKRMTVAGKVR